MLTLEQKQIRLTGVGASESATLFNLNEYSTPYRMWMEKTQKLPDDDEMSDPMWWGSELESVIVDRYKFETGNDVIIDKETKYSELTPYMLCHLDGIVKGSKTLLEVKTAHYNPSKWGESGSSQIPPQYQIQCQHQLACMPGFDSVDLVVLFKQTFKIQIYHIKRNDELISKIVKSIDKFWTEHVLADVSPELWDAQDVKIAYPVNNDTWMDATPFELDTADKLKDVNAQIKSLTADKAKLQGELIVLNGAHTGMKYDGSIVFTYKTNKSGNRTFNFPWGKK